MAVIVLISMMTVSPSVSFISGSVLVSSMFVILNLMSESNVILRFWSSLPDQESL